LLRNYLTIAIRNLTRHPGYATINVVGLAVGVGCCILVGLFAMNEIGYDRHHPLSDRTYRLIREMRVKDGDSKFTSGVLGPIGPAIRESIPEVESAVRFWDRWSWVRAGDREFERRFYVVEEGFLELFPQRVDSGELESLRTRPFTAAITQTTARMLFGDVDPVGKTFRCDYKYVVGDYTVVAVIADPAENTNYTLDVLTMTVHTGYWMHHVWEEWRPQSNWRPVDVMLLLREDADVEAVERKLAQMVRSGYGDTFADQYSYHLQPLRRAHLYSQKDYGMRPTGDIDRVLMMLVGGFFVLLVACINYVNLATARSATRAREVGLRKVVGALRRQLAGQFLGESLVFSLLATTLGIAIAALALPAFNAYTQRELVLGSAGPLALVLSLLVVALTVGVCAGAYPALLLSRLQAAIAIKGAGGSRRRVSLRKTLVVIQFAISVGLITGTLIVNRQLDYMRSKELGFDADQIIGSWILGNVDLHSKWREVKERYLRNPDILEVTATSSYVGVWAEYWQFAPEGYQDETVQLYTMAVDEDFIGFFDIPLLKGENLPEYLPADSTLSILLNESAVKKLGWEEPVGKRFETKTQHGSRMGYVVGVVRDFHGRSLHSAVEPMVLVKYPPSFRNISYRIKGGRIEETIAFLKEIWKDLWPTTPFSYSFYDQVLERQYRQEVRTSRLFQVLSSIAVVVACLGLVGLASFTVEQRTREIGIRKAVGASPTGIVGLLTREFLVLVLVAGALASPLTMYASAQWLEGFAYRAEPDVLVFVVGMILAAVAAVLVISLHVIRAARTDPVDALRYE
jgi:putative ABC transport system permease protein